MDTIEKKQLTISGKLNGFKANKHGDIDALEIENAGEVSTIKFPPHTAKEITEEVMIGELVSLSYKEEKAKHDPSGNKKPKFKLLTLNKTGDHELVIDHIKPKQTSGDKTPEKLLFNNFEIISGKKGELAGIRSGKKLVHIHKENEEIAKNIKSGCKLEIEAVKRTDDGFINKNEDEVYHIQSIKIDGKEYSIKKGK